MRVHKKFTYMLRQAINQKLTKSRYANALQNLADFLLISVFLNFVGICLGPSGIQPACSMSPYILILCEIWTHETFISGRCAYRILLVILGLLECCYQFIQSGAPSVARSCNIVSFSVCLKHCLIDANAHTACQSLQYQRYFNFTVSTAGGILIITVHIILYSIRDTESCLISVKRATSTQIKTMF